MQYKEKWESIFAKTACLIDWNMLIPLNNIIIMYNAANEEEQDDVCKLLDIEPYEFPSFDGYLLGLKWSFMAILSSISLLILMLQRQLFFEMKNLRKS